MFNISLECPLGKSSGMPLLWTLQQLTAGHNTVCYSSVHHKNGQKICASSQSTGLAVAKCAWGLMSA
jgi:hypothetical protein